MALSLYKELLTEVEDASVYLEEYARQMIGQEGSTLELRKMMYDFEPKIAMAKTSSMPGKACRKRQNSAIFEILAGYRHSADALLSIWPVIGIRIDDRLEWFKKLRKSKDASALNRAVQRGKIPTAKKLHVKKRSGKLRT